MHTLITDVKLIANVYEESTACNDYCKNLFHFNVLETSILVKSLAADINLHYSIKIFWSLIVTAKGLRFILDWGKIAFHKLSRKTFVFKKRYFANEFCNRERCRITGMKVHMGKHQHHLPVCIYWRDSPYHKGKRHFCIFLTPASISERHHKVSHWSISILFLVVY